MCAKWIKDKDPDHLASRLEDIKNIGQDGKVSFSGLGLTVYTVVLNGMVSLSNTITEYEKNIIVHKAIFNVAKREKISSSGLLQEIIKLEKTILKQKPQRFVLVSTLSINRFLKLKRVQINDAIITFHSRLSKSFSKEIENKIYQAHSATTIDEVPQDYIFVKTSVNAKTYYQASQIAIEALDTIRGIWNLFYNRGRFRVSSGPKYPVNNISFGPIHTIHFPNGKLASETWLYEAGYLGPLKAFNLRNNQNDLYEFQKRIRGFLKKNKLKKEMEIALQRYSQALDIRDWESSYLRLWGLLESLTNTNENESHKDTVKRASFFFKEVEYERQVLNYLRDHRNDFVHAGESNINIETLLYMLKHYVENILEFRIGNKFNFSNKWELIQFMNLPKDISELKRTVDVIEYAIKFLGH